jgi:hypothetical protein
MRALATFRGLTIASTGPVNAATVLIPGVACPAGILGRLLREQAIRA